MSVLDGWIKIFAFNINITFNQIVLQWLIEMHLLPTQLSLIAHIM